MTFEAGQRIRDRLKVTRPGDESDLGTVTEVDGDLVTVEMDTGPNRVQKHLIDQAEQVFEVVPSEEKERRNG